MIACDVRRDFHWLFGKRMKVKSSRFLQTIGDRLALKRASRSKGTIRTIRSQRKLKELERVGIEKVKQLFRDMR